MMRTRSLQMLLDVPASRCPFNIAVEETDGQKIEYGKLARLSDRVRDRLVHLGVRPGDRVGICMRKSADAIASMFGIMKAGAAYVPTDPMAPVARNAFVFQDCAVKALIAERRLAELLHEEFE